MTDFILYTHPYSRGRAVRWMLEECGAHYEARILDYDGNMKEPAYLAINPLGKVPSLVHHGKIITETAAICTYLADLFPAKKLVPNDRADYYRWLFFISGPLEAAYMDKMLDAKVKPELKRAVGYGSLEAAVKMLEQHLESHPFIAGDHFSAADCIAVSSCLFAQRTHLVESAIFSRYCDMHMARPAFQKAAMIDDQLLKDMAG